VRRFLSGHDGSGSVDEVDESGATNVPSLASESDALTTPHDSPASRRRALFVAATAALAVIIAAGVVVGVQTGSHHKSGATSRPHAGPPKPTVVPTPALIGLGDGISLMSRVIAPPPGTHEDVVPGGSDGVFTANQYAKEFFVHPSTAVAFLRSCAYQTAAVRIWDDASGIVDVQVLQFTTTDGAQQFLVGQRHVYVDDLDVTGDRAITGLPNASRFEYEKPDSQGYTRDVSLVSDANYVVMIMAHRDAIDVDADEALLHQQLDMLARA
jgi:hypothetical protein